MTKRKLKRILQADYGKTPDIHYFAGDMENIRSYFDFRCKNEMDEFLVDNTTWYDLDMDEVYRRVNPGLTTSGEQYLYYMLRSPAIEEACYRERAELIALMQRENELRLKIQMILARLGRTRRADMCSAFYPEHRSPLMLIVYLLLCLAVPVSAAAIAFAGQQAVVALILAVMVNGLVHSFMTRRIQRDLDTVNYSVGMVFTLHRLKKLKSAELDRHLSRAYESLENLKSVIRSGGVSTATDGGGLGELICSVLLLDLVTYEFLKNKLGKNHKDVFTIHEYLGKLDAAIAVASYRESLAGGYCLPEIDFGGKAFMEAEAMRHPLISDAVPNSLRTDKSILVTGSNASGKSTFLKTAALCALMGQSICTCIAVSYRASAFRALSSMALRDDILSGESYYIVETRSLKRILDSVNGNPPVLCVVDEVLRGTNTVERIAASSQVLQSMAERGALCLAATHDIELCGLLGQTYELYHFEERVGEDKMMFDYTLHPGKATSRNAINLLKLIGFGDEIVDGAHARANRYMDSGVWE